MHQYRMTALETEIRRIMHNNARESRGYRYTVPSPELYPFQWLWDSCFHAITLRHFDLSAAKDEIHAALAMPLPDGLLPHIIFWKDDHRIVNWGRERRGDIINNAWGTEHTSSLTQPPVIAEAVRILLDEHFDRSFAEAVYPKLAAYYRALITERDLEGRGLLGILNPDESGEDNSPRFDHILRLPAAHTNDEHLDRRIALIEQHAACAFEERCMQPFFWVEDVPFNAIALVGLRALAGIAEKLKQTADACEFNTYADTIGTAMRTYMLRGHCFYSIDRTEGTDTLIPTKTWALFAPLYAGIATDEEAQMLVIHYLENEQEFGTPFPIPSTACSEATFNRDGFWRGPTWIAPNWFIHQGLVRYGFHTHARTLAERTRALLAQSGFREQYDPISGNGLGAHHFTWGGLVLDMD